MPSISDPSSHPALIRGHPCPPDGFCPPEGRCENPFSRVVVSYLVRSGTQVFWGLRSDFYDPGPFRFTLQVNSARANTDWTNVGLEVVDQYVAVDSEQRARGQYAIRKPYYRVKLVTPIATYYSDPVASEGTLSLRDWRIARDVLRQEMV